MNSLMGQISSCTVLVSERMACLENAICCTTEDRFHCRGGSFWIPQCADQLRSPSTLKFRNKAVGFLNDKFYSVALYIGTGTKMYHKESSRSFCTLDDQGHFCTSVGGEGRELPTRMLPTCSQYFMPFLGPVQPSVAWILVAMSQHYTYRHLYFAVKYTYTTYVALFLRLLSGLMSSLSYTWTTFVLPKELTQETATSFNSKVWQAHSDCSPPRTSEGKPGWRVGMTSRRYRT